MLGTRSIVVGGLLALTLTAGCSSSPKAQSTSTSTTTAVAAGSTTIAGAVGTTPGVGGASTTAAPAASGGGGACGLLTSDEVSTVLGITVTPSEHDQNGVRSCQFKSAAQPTGGTVLVEVLNGDATAFDTAVKNFPVATSPVTGLGDQAAFAADAGEIGVLTGTHILLIIDVHDGQVFGSQQELTGLATKALPRLASIG